MSITSLGGPVDLDAPRILHFATVRAEIAEPVEVPLQGRPTRVVFPITGGEISGDGVQGHIVPGGADFAELLDNGTYLVDARYSLKFADGTTVMIRNAGRMIPQPDGSYQGQTSARFDAPAGPFAWLNDHIFIGRAYAEADREDRVFIDVWKVL